MFTCGSGAYVTNDISYIVIRNRVARDAQCGTQLKSIYLTQYILLQFDGVQTLFDMYITVINNRRRPPVVYFLALKSTTTGLTVCFTSDATARHSNLLVGVILTPLTCHVVSVEPSRRFRLRPIPPESRPSPARLFPINERRFRQSPDVEACTIPLTTTPTTPQSKVVTVITTASSSPDFTSFSTSIAVP